MPTTTTTDFTHAVSAIGNRTNSAGAAVDDITAEELRFAQVFWTEGAVQADAFKVGPGSGMQVLVGSGTAKADYYVVSGDIAGQGNYVVRLDAATQAITVPASDPSQARTDEVYLYVADAPYDSGSVSLPRLGYRKGDNGGAAPGPDTAWKASAKLATVAVAAAASSITAANITDARTLANVAPPTGTMSDFAGSTVPSGALACDGSAVSRTTYSRLFRVIGTTHGAGNGTTTFNLPDSRGRVAVGIKSGETEFDTLGETGGAKTHSLTVGEMPNHDHGGSTSSNGAHTHLVDTSQAVNGTAIITEQSAGVDGTASTSSDGAHTHTITAQGSGTAHNNLQPYLVVTKIIWV